MRIPFTRIEVHSPVALQFPVSLAPVEEEESPFGWAHDVYMSMVDATSDEGSRYLSMMYAAFVRECKVPPEFVSLVELRNLDGSKVYYFADQREIFPDDEY